MVAESARQLQEREREREAATDTEREREKKSHRASGKGEGERDGRRADTARKWREKEWAAVWGNGREW